MKPNCEDTDNEKSVNLSPVTGRLFKELRKVELEKSELESKVFGTEMAE